MELKFCRDAILRVSDCCLSRDAILCVSGCCLTEQHAVPPALFSYPIPFLSSRPQGEILNAICSRHAFTPVPAPGIWKVILRDWKEKRGRKSEVAWGKGRGLEIVHLGGRRLDDGLESEDESHRERDGESLVALDTRASDGNEGELG